MPARNSKQGSQKPSSKPGNAEVAFPSYSTPEKKTVPYNYSPSKKQAF